MPELPEVETVTTHLRALVRGRTIRDAQLLRPRLAPSHTADEFGSLLAGATINDITRRGKHILVGLNTDRTLIVHLRMSGRFSLLNGGDEAPKFTHATFDLGSGSTLVYSDQRHFGMMKIVATETVFEAPEIAKLAPEPFSDEFSLDQFWTTLRSTSRPLKEVLLDQTKVCGVGNIYASEAMFLAKLSPRMAANRVSRPKAAVLRDTIRLVLSETIELGRALTPDPTNIGGNIYGEGSDAAWRVYGREGDACPECKRPIKRIMQKGRSTFYCGGCQRA